MKTLNTNEVMTVSGGLSFPQVVHNFGDNTWGLKSELIGKTFKVPFTDIKFRLHFDAGLDVV